MARRITGGLVGSSTLLGTIQISPESTMSTAADQDITFSPGAGGLVVSTSAVQLNTQNDLRFADADSSNYVGFRSPPTVTINQIWTLPATDGALDQVLTTNSSGVLSWSSKSVVISDQTTSATIHYPLFTTSTSGTATSASVSTTRMTFQPSTGTFRLLGNIASSSTTTGTMIVSGGLGISGALYAGVIPGVSGYVPQNGGATLPDTDRKYIVSNTAGITLTLPLTSTDGRTITIVDGNNFGTFNVTLGRNTRLIGGLAENLILNLQGSKVELVYRGGDWKVFAI